jgi:hypothetical protein
LLLLSVAGNSLKLSELQLTCSLQHSTPADVTGTGHDVTVLLDQLCAPAALLPPSIQPAQLSPATLDRIRNWSLARAIAVATAFDHGESSDEEGKLELANDDLLARATTESATANDNLQNNVFLADDMQMKVPGGDCAHKNVWTLLQFVQGLAKPEPRGEVERFSVLPNTSCECLLLLPAKQKSVADEIATKLSQIVDAVPPAEIQTGKLLLYKEKVPVRY